MSKKDVEQLVHSIMPKDLLKPPNVNFFSFSKSYGGSSFSVVQCLHTPENEASVIIHANLFSRKRRKVWKVKKMMKTN